MVLEAVCHCLECQPWHELVLHVTDYVGGLTGEQWAPARNSTMDRLSEVSMLTCAQKETGKGTICPRVGCTHVRSQALSAKGNLVVLAAVHQTYPVPNYEARHI
jgi:hypothetical protein